MSFALKPRIMTVYGTRPEAIKVAPVIQALDADERFVSIPVSTGQHREMLDQVNAMFGITPAHNLALMHEDQPLNMLLSRALAGLDRIIEQEQPHVIIAQGDTTSALSAAMAGFNRGTYVVHLEAGLRTDNLAAPFPEEGNRRMISGITSLHLAPTESSMENLRKENVRSRDIVVTGNTVIDALIEAASWRTPIADENVQTAIDSGKRIVLVTTHRRENIENMRDIGEAIKDLAWAFPDVYFVIPLHVNPQVRAKIMPFVSNMSNVIITSPMGYDEFTTLLSNSYLVLTDSGGIQEEAPALGKPVLVMRELTERPEAVLAGTVKLVGTARKHIVAQTTTLLKDPVMYTAMANAVNPYGDGRAAERTVAAIAQLTGVGARLPDFDPLPAHSPYAR
ncbi:MAG: UDP-N-acetylglucosamine 2-epimerase (non-hydrolyzing) [Corynebacterium sp.]|nr:UDP-N-acetylglucosamine 2-epimerase (non-hydrolyzing) [Corynebacterium sp.]